MSNKASGKGKNASGGSGPRGKPTPRKGAGVAAAARQPTSRRGTLAGVVVVVVLVVVIAGFLYQRTRTTPVNNGYGAATTAQVMVTNGVVRVGAANAPVTLNVFEDFNSRSCSRRVDVAEEEQRHSRALHGDRWWIRRRRSYSSAE